jgi:hypothetical protein
MTPHLGEVAQITQNNIYAQKESLKNWLLKWKIKNKIRHYQRELNKIK